MKDRGRLLRDYPFPEPEPEPESKDAAHPERTPEHHRPRTATLRGAPLSKLRPPSIMETIVIDIDPDEEVTEVRVKSRAQCTSCGYLARHVHTFPDGLCGLCRTTIRE
jgi:hypothetical protein